MDRCPRLDRLRTLRLLCAGVLALICASHAAAQPGASYTQRHWTTEEGLPVNTVRDLVQGPQGYLWLATYAGLVQFDGVEFSAMTAANSGLPTSRLHAAERGPEGHLWVQTDGSQLVEVDPRRRAVRAVYGNGAGGMPSFANEWAAGPDSTLWIGTSSMLYRRALGAGAWEEAVPHPIDVVALEKAPEGGVWVGTVEQGVWRATPDTAWQVADRTPAGHRPAGLTALAVGPTGAWVGGEEGVFRISEGSLDPVPTVSPPPIGRPLVLSALADSSFWIHTRNTTLYRVHRPRTGDPAVRRVGSLPVGADRPVRMGPEGRRWTLLENRVEAEGRPALRTGEAIQALLRDREGNWWVGTAGDGLYRLRRTPIRMVGSDDGLPAENVYGIAAGRTHSSSVWVGSIGGGLTRIRTERGGSPAVTPLQAAWGLPSIVWTAHEDRSGTLWIGTEEGLYRRRDGRATQGGLPPLLQNRTIRAVYEDRSRRLWVLFGGTLYVRSGGTWHRVSRSRVFPRAESGTDGRVIAQTQNGSVWIGTDGAGLVRVRGNSIGRLQIGRVRVADGMPSGRIRSIYEDSTGALWVGTGDQGLAHVDRQGTLRLADDSITAITRANGLPGNTISQILPGGQTRSPETTSSLRSGPLWMSTNRGIFRVEKQELLAFVRAEIDRVNPVVYTEDDGLASREANGGVHSAGTRTSRQGSGRLWFPTQEGIAVIDPSGVEPTPPPPAAIEALSTADTTVSVATGDTLRLRPEQRTFTVRYAGLHFREPAATRYTVRLEGFDRRPTRTGGRSVRYTEVSPGTYTFRVRAAGERGAWGPPAPLTITVAPFWWETGWFYGLCGLGLVGLALAGYRWRTRRLRRRQEELEATVAERTEEIREQRDRLEELDRAKSRFFANLSHEFRTPLTLIRGPVQEVREHLERSRLEALPAEEAAEQLQLAERNTARLRRLVDQLLGLARLEAGTYQIAARPTDLGPAIARLVRRFEPLAERKGLTIEVETEAASERREPVYVDREALEHVVGNLVSNAIKFTPEGGQVDVTVTEEADRAAIAVADTGPGVPEREQAAIFDRFQQSQQSSGRTREQEGVGIGLAFAQDLVLLHGGSIDLESTEGEGATFTVRLPRGPDHLSDDQLREPPSDSSTASDAGTPEDTASSLESAASTDPQLATLDPAPSSLDSSSSSEGASLSDSSDTSVDQSPIQNSQSTRASATDEAKRSKIVLVVDDNADVRQYVRSVLEPEYVVIEASDGAEGAETAREAPPDVILADVMMPTMDGVEMTRRLKNDPETEAIPVIMVTARAGTQDEVEGLQAGADDYVTKPFDADVLRQRVGGVLRLQQRLRRRLEEELQAEEEPWSATEAEERPEIEREARQVIREHLTDPDFGVADLAGEMAMSRSTLYRKLKAEADVSPSTLVTRVRIEKGAALLERGEPVTQVAYAVGYTSLTGFTGAFEEARGVTPGTYAAEA